MKSNNKTSIILLVLVAGLGLLMWMLSVHQSQELTEQGQDIDVLREQLTGVESNAVKNAELTLNTAYCRDIPARRICREAEKTVENVGKTPTRPEGRTMVEMVCAPNGQWIITLDNGATWKPEGQCRVNPTTDPDYTPLPTPSSTETTTPKESK